MDYATLLEDARDYYRLCNEAAALGIPVSLDDPATPQTVEGLREAVRVVRETCKHSTA